MIVLLKSDTILMEDYSVEMELYDVGNAPTSSSYDYTYEFFVRKFDGTILYFARFSDLQYALDEYEDMFERALQGIKFWNEKY